MHFHVVFTLVSMCYLFLIYGHSGWRLITFNHFSKNQLLVPFTDFSLLCFCLQFHLFIFVKLMIFALSLFCSFSPNLLRYKLQLLNWDFFPFLIKYLILQMPIETLLQAHPTGFDMLHFPFIQFKIFSNFFCNFNLN